MTEHPPLVHIRASETTSSTAQSPGMHRLEGISGASAGSSALWMGETRVAAGARSANHHHGESETAIYVVSGRPEFVFLRDGVEERIQARPGDYVYVPPFTPHREENLGGEEAVVVLARTTQEAIVVNLAGLSEQDVP